MNLERKFIKCKSKKHGEKIKRFFIENGVKNEYKLSCDLAGVYYGCVSGKILSSSKAKKKDLFKLPKTKIKFDLHPEVKNYLSELANEHSFTKSEIINDLIVHHYICNISLGLDFSINEVQNVSKSSIVCREKIRHRGHTKRYNKSLYLLLYGEVKYTNTEVD